MFEIDAKIMKIHRKKALIPVPKFFFKGNALHDYLKIDNLNSLTHWILSSNSLFSFAIVQKAWRIYDTAIEALKVCEKCLISIC